MATAAHRSEYRLPITVLALGALCTLGWFTGAYLRLWKSGGIGPGIILVIGYILLGVGLILLVGTAISLWRRR